MSTKAIREFTGKNLWLKYQKQHGIAPSQGSQFVQVTPKTDLKSLPKDHPWLSTEKLVVKVDQLIKRRGKQGLIKVNATYDEVVAWLSKFRNKVFEANGGKVSGVLDHFLIETMTAHEQGDEYYVCIHNKRWGDELLFHHQGGVDVGDIDAKAARLLVPIDEGLDAKQLGELVSKAPKARHAGLVSFVSHLFACYREYHFAYLEINPIAMVDARTVVALDMAAKIDETAGYLCFKKWGRIDFPAPFGRAPSPAEAYIKSLDAKTGASLKLTVLNQKGRIWCMVAGGGASVVYADTVCDLGGASEMANYGEYSGDPPTKLTYEYAKTILGLVTEEPHPQGKILIIGGGIANFTDVANTFKGIIQALRERADTLKRHNVRIFVRRGGPNYQEGLANMRALAAETGLAMEVYGPEDHMTSIVSRALGQPVKTTAPRHVPHAITVKSLGSQPAAPPAAAKETKAAPAPTPAPAPAPTVKHLATAGEARAMFTPKTRALVYGMQTRAVQNMLDFDYLCHRQPSVAGIVYTFGSGGFRKFYFGRREVLLPVFGSLDAALAKCPDVDTVVSFASLRSVFASTRDMLRHSRQIRTIAIIAEGVPERLTRQLNMEARKKQVTIIGPATVGGNKPGSFRIGNAGGMLDNVIASKLYRPGSVAYVSKSGGMSNELNNILARFTDGVCEGLAIGGDRYPGTTFVDHLKRYEDDPNVKMMVVLGEVGGVEEYEIIRLKKAGVLTKPMVAWCIGTCAEHFAYSVQFGHAGASVQGEGESASDKNRALRAAGIHVPTSFEHFPILINEVYASLVDSGAIVVRPEPTPPAIPVDYNWALKLGLVRKPSSIVCSITDDRGEELIYGGLPLSKVIGDQMGVGGVIGLIWFRRPLPAYFARFIELVLCVTADHGPAVSGAHNCIVAARAGKDLMSSVASGMLTIGPRFGGALDEAARMFTEAHDSGLDPEEFVNQCKKKGRLIMGIGHKIKSLENPDGRVTEVVNFARKHFPNTHVMDYALAVQGVTTRKKSSLILNVDGCIAVSMVDLLRSCDAFSAQEANDFVKWGVLNGLFVLARTIGMIGHYIDQKRLKQPLYRHDTTDISYLVHDDLSF